VGIFCTTDKKDVKKDLVETMLWFRKFAEHGNTDA